MKPYKRDERRLSLVCLSASAEAALFAHFILAEVTLNCLNNSYSMPDVISDRDGIFCCRVVSQ
jgi:hypothetical protein